MLARISGLIILITAASAGPAAALNDYPAYLQKYKRAYFSPAVREDHKIRFGYYPYYFSNAARARHSYSAAEKGHYRAGSLDTPWPFPSEKFRLQPNHADPTRVLTSGDPSNKQRKLHDYIEQRMREAKSREAEPRVHDSRELQSVIERHKWEYQSPEMRKAVQRDADDVRADPTDYLRLFQDN